MQSLSHATVSHLTTRFGSYYKNQSILAEMAGPALEDIRLEMKETASSSKSRLRKPFRIYSCHDVTILSLLFAIRDRFLVCSDDEIKRRKPGSSSLDESNNDSHCLSRSEWPMYATCLTFELIRVKAMGEKGGDDKFIVKAWLNGPPIPKFHVVPVSFITEPEAQQTDKIDLAKIGRAHV